MSDEISKLIEQSKDTSVIFGKARRRGAVKKLGEIGNARVVVALIEALEDDDADIQRFAFKGLSGLKEVSAQEVLRSMYIRTKSKALLQIIKHNKMYPSGIVDNVIFLTKAELKEELTALVTEENFDEIIASIVQSESEEAASALSQVVDTLGGKFASSKIIKKFIETKSDVLFDVIDKNNWYPPDLEKKIMFLLKTSKYQKFIELLEGMEFKEILDIVLDQRFPMKKQAEEAMMLIESQFIIDELCHIFMENKDSQLGKLIVQNNWAPAKSRDRIFFYLGTEVLKSFFMREKIDVMHIGGYYELPAIRKKLKEIEYIPLSDLLRSIAIANFNKEKFDLENNNAIEYAMDQANEYLSKPRTSKEIKEICDEYLESKSPYLAHLILKMDWAPEDFDEQVKFYLKADMEKKLKQLSERAVQPLYELMRESSNKEDLSGRARNILKSLKTQGAIEKVFKLFFSTFDRELESIIKENKWLPADIHEKALYYIFSGQLDKYTEIEPEGFKVLFEAYRRLDSTQRFKLIEIMVKQRSENFTDFLVSLFEFEKNPQVLKILCTIIVVFFTRVYKTLLKLIPKLEGAAVTEIIKTLSQINTEGSREMLYRIGKDKGGMTFLWVLKFLEEARWSPQNNFDLKFFYDYYKIRGELHRILQNNIVDVDPEVRATTAYEFAEMGDEKFLPLLLKYVEDPVEDVRTAVAYAIGHICALAPEKALEQIDSFSIGSIYMIFNDVRKAFMVNSDQEKLQILAKNFEIGNLVLRVFSVSALEGLQKRESIKTLIKALEDSSLNVKKTALRSLAQIADWESKDALYSYLQNQDEELRHTAARGLSNIADEAIADKIENVISKNDYGFYDAMIEVLANTDAEKYRMTFERILKSPVYDHKSKAAAARAMAMVKDSTAEAFLIDQLRNLQGASDRLEEQIPFIQAFGIIGSSSLYPILDEMLKTENYKVRYEVITALGNIPDRVALVTIIKALEDSNALVQMAALKSLSKFIAIHFEFKKTDKDLRFLAAIVDRLEKFKINHFVDKYFTEHQIFSQLSVKLLINQITGMYLKYKNMLERENDPQIETKPDMMERRLK